MVTVTAVAAALAVVSALFALVFLRYGIPCAARNGPTHNGQETVGCSVALCVGNAGLVVAFLLIVAQCVATGIDPLLSANPCPIPAAAVCIRDDWPGFDSYFMTLWWMRAALIAALIWYTLSLAVLPIEMSAGRSRGQRKSASLESE